MIINKIPQSKICNVCGIEKSLDDFSPLKHGKFGRHPKCRSCRNAENRRKSHQFGNWVFIYVLIDPKSGIPSYVGRSGNPARRLRWHISDAKCSPHVNPRKTKWILDLLSSDLIPQLKIIEAVLSLESATREKFWIQYYRNLNPKLLNATP